MAVVASVDIEVADTAVVVVVGIEVVVAAQHTVALDLEPSLHHNLDKTHTILYLCSTIRTKHLIPPFTEVVVNTFNILYTLQIILIFDHNFVQNAIPSVISTWQFGQVVDFLLQQLMSTLMTKFLI